MKLLLDITSIQQNFDLQTKRSTSFLVASTAAGDLHVPVPEELIGLVIEAASTDEVLDLSSAYPIPEEASVEVPKTAQAAEAEEGEDETAIASTVREIIDAYQGGYGISGNDKMYLVCHGIDFDGLVAAGKISEPPSREPEDPAEPEDEQEEREFSMPEIPAVSMGTLEGDEGQPAGPVSSVIENLKAKARSRPGKPKSTPAMTKVPEASDDIFPQG